MFDYKRCSAAELNDMALDAKFGSPGWKWIATGLSIGGVFLFLIL
jgi:hypothetical protein